MSEHKTMTMAEIAAVCQVDKTTIQRWALKAIEPGVMQNAQPTDAVCISIKNKIKAAENTPAKFSFEETVAIIRAGNKPLADFMESNALHQDVSTEATEAVAWTRLFGKYGYTPEQLLDAKITEEAIAACRRVPGMDSKTIKRMRLLVNHRPFIKFSNKDIANHVKMSEHTVARIARMFERQTKAVHDCIYIMRSFGKTSMFVQGQTAFQSAQPPVTTLPAPEAQDATNT